MNNRLNELVLEHSWKTVRENIGTVRGKINKNKTYNIQTSIEKRINRTIKDLSEYYLKDDLLLWYII